MTSVRCALALSFTERYILIAISLTGNILLARLLTPEEIGIYSVSLAVIGIAQVLRDFGIGNFLIQEKELTEAHIRTAFGISLLIGFLLFSITYFGAPLAAIFYGKPQFEKTILISALNFLILPFCSISVAMLRREMAFGRLMVVTLVATIGSFAVTISLAYSGIGPNSMAIGAVFGNVLTGMGAWVARSKRELLLPSLSEWRKLLNFGAQSSVANIVTTIAMDINDLAIGKILGFAPVAMISRAQGLMNLFHRDLMSAIRNVAFPAFSKAHRENQAIETLYVTSVTAVTVIAWPFYGFVSLFSIEILRLMFGSQWDAVAILVPVFCLAGAIGATTTLITTVMLAVGRIELVTKSELIFQPLRAILIILAAMSFKSLMACALAYLLAYIIYVPFIYAVKERCIPSNVSLLARQLWQSLQVTLMALTLPFFLAQWIGIDREQPSSILILISAATLAIAGWMIGLIYFKHPLTRDPLYVSLFSRLNKKT